MKITVLLNELFTMNSSINSCVSILNSLVVLAAKYQLSISGQFTISRYKSKNEINNELFGNCDLKCINSGRLNFDGGIELTLIATGELANIFNECGNDCSLLVKIYNLNNEDCDLENYLISDREDCDFLNVDKEIVGDNAVTLATKLDSYWNGDRIGALRSYCAMKLGYAN